MSDVVLKCTVISPDGQVTLHKWCPQWSNGLVTTAVPAMRHTFCVCLLAMDQLSVDDRRCRMG
jgi:hypothetical protein